MCRKECQAGPCAHKKEGTTSMKPMLMLLTLIPVLTTSCGGPKEPEDVVEAMFRAAQEDD